MKKIILFLWLLQTNFLSENKKSPETNKKNESLTKNQTQNKNKKTKKDESPQSPKKLTITKKPITSKLTKQPAKETTISECNRFINIEDSSCCQNCIFQNTSCKCSKLACTILAIC